MACTIIMANSSMMTITLDKIHINLTHWGQSPYCRSIKGMSQTSRVDKNTWYPWWGCDTKNPTSRGRYVPLVRRLFRIMCGVWPRYFYTSSEEDSQAFWEAVCSPCQVDAIVHRVWSAIQNGNNRLQQSHTDLYAHSPEYDKETHKFSLIHWSPSTIKPVIFQNHKEEHDSVNRKKWHK